MALVNGVGAVVGVGVGVGVELLLGLEALLEGMQKLRVITTNSLNNHNQICILTRNEAKNLKVSITR